jgi:hypothetical protein
VNAAGTSDWKATDVLREPFEIKWYYVHIVDRIDKETGEVTDGVRLVLITPERKLISCSGSAVRRALAEIIRCKGPGPWTPAVPVILESQKGSNGHNYHIMRVVASPATPAKKGK